MKTITEFKQYILNNKNQIIASKASNKALNNAGFMELINNMYNDSYSVKEKIYCIVNDIIERPKCPICGKDIPFNTGGYMIGCSRECCFTYKRNIKNEQKKLNNIKSNKSLKTI